MLFAPLRLSATNLPGVLIVILASTLAFVGLGVMAATLPVLSPERGAEGTHIFQGSLLVVSGVDYPVDVLPSRIGPLSMVSPATYTLSACRKLVGIGNPVANAGQLVPAPLSAVTGKIVVLVTMGFVMIPLGLCVFGRASDGPSARDA